LGFASMRFLLGTTGSMPPHAGAPIGAPADHCRVIGGQWLLAKPWRLSGGRVEPSFGVGLCESASCRSAPAVLMAPSVRVRA
jgi:hypothetical protein